MVHTILMTIQFIFIYRAFLTQKTLSLEYHVSGKSQSRYEISQRVCECVASLFMLQKIKNLTSDITRGTVQKSVCVLSRLPLYGHIQVKMFLITHAYFEEGDFSKVSLLEKTYHHLNDVLSQTDTPLQSYEGKSQHFQFLVNRECNNCILGLSLREFILQWRHKALLLFKLLLLEKRLIFYKSPVLPLCSTILSLISLQPKMIEEGLNQSACIKLVF